MNKVKHSRLLVPGVMAVVGSAISIASLVGAGWRGALAVEVVTVVATIGYYLLGGRDSDVGALFGSRTDERQENIGMRVAALTGTVMTYVALGGFIVATAMGRFVWPFALFCGVGGVTCVIGLVIYRQN